MLKPIKKLFFALFCISGMVFYSCKKYPGHSNYYLYSKATRISNTWKLDRAIGRKNSPHLDNTRVILNFQNKGEFTWLSMTTSLGVENAILHQGNWKFIERQSKIVLEEPKSNLLKRDTFQIIALTKDRLVLLPHSYNVRRNDSLEFLLD